MAKSPKKSTTPADSLKVPGLSSEAQAEQKIIRLNKASRAALMWWENYWSYLAREREKKLDEIKLAVSTAGIPSFHKNGLSRIVTGAHTKSPLSVVGSLRIAGRFNIGNISSSQRSFHCLYLASDEETAQAEKFLHTENDGGEGNLTPEEMYTQPKGPYLHCTVNVELTNLLDLRKKESLTDFLDIISDIKIPKPLRQRGNYLKIRPMPKVISNIDILISSIFEKNFKQWQTYISAPSNSQWIGFYAYLAGMQGVIYPSLRNPAGYNVAVYPDNLKDTTSFVIISPNIEHVSPDNLRMDGKSYSFFEKDLPNSGAH